MQSAWKDRVKALEGELAELRQKSYEDEPQKKSTTVQDNFTEPDVLTPPSSSEVYCAAPAACSSLCATDLPDSSASSSGHDVFLQNVRELKAAAEAISEDGLVAMSIETMRSAIDAIICFLLETSGDVSCRNEEAGYEAVSVIGRLTEAKRFSIETATAIRDLVLDAIKRLLTAIVNDDSLNNKGAKQSVAKFHLCRNILLLSQTASLRNGILCLLFEQLTECCTMLRRSVTYNLLPNIVLRNNTDYVFWCIEHMLSYCETESVKELSRQFISDCSTHFKQFLSYIYKDFPSFAYSLWHLCELLEHVQDKCEV